jgi:hypothetical protein
MYSALFCSHQQVNKPLMKTHELRIRVYNRTSAARVFLQSHMLPRKVEILQRKREPSRNAQITTRECVQVLYCYILYCVVLLYFINGIKIETSQKRRCILQKSRLCLQQLEIRHFKNLNLFCKTKQRKPIKDANR